MSVSCWLIIISIIIAFIILILFISKKMCDMAIKTEIAKKYSMLIFTPEQKEVMDKTDLEAIKWLEQNATEVEIISRDGGIIYKSSSNNSGGKKKSAKKSVQMQDLMYQFGHFEL